MGSKDNDQIAEYHDILILGAGLSGINTAHLLRQHLPHRSFAILEAREVVGGTWSFFRYPGFRSDSYLYTFGLKWFPWPHAKKIAPGPLIAAYLEDAARQDGTFEAIRFGHKVTHCEWRDQDQFWRLTIDHNGSRSIFAAKFVFGCMGYYSYDRALQTVVPGLDSFQGTVVHPQWWPRDLDYTDRRVVIIGSGATAYTMVPAMVDKAANITMLQRSPTWAVAVSSTSTFEPFASKFLPGSWVRWLSWWMYLLLELISSRFLLKFPKVGRFALSKALKRQIPKTVDASIHFNPRYDPWKQRLCMCPDGDFMKALHKPNCEVVTDIVSTVTAHGIQLKSGRVLPADIIVTATGLHLELLGGMKPVVNGESIDVGSRYTWRGGMLESVPNMAYMFGYIRQSWTLGADVMARLIIRVIQSMEKKQATKVVPTLERWEGMPRQLAIDANSTYILAAADRLPKITGSDPWYGREDWLRDIWTLRFGDADKGLVYSRRVSKKAV